MLVPLAFALFPSAAFAQSFVTATQIDAGLYDVETPDDTGGTELVGWVEVHDFRPTLGAPLERHEHWYLDKLKWNPETPTVVFKYHQAPLGHGRYPSGAAGHHHYGFHVVKGLPTEQVALPLAGSPVGCADEHLCSTFHTLKDAGGAVFGYVNVWEDGGKARELYFLDPVKFVPPSPGACVTAWNLERHDAPLPPVVGKPPDKVAPTGTLTWDNRLAVQDGLGAADRGTTAVVLADKRPKCPPP